ncbi:MAG: hypothetical protein MZV63_46610 [Marinilabiliales bacterium]|nr:hypothetical protein [Marinilabiliales bacterium]
MEEVRGGRLHRLDAVGAADGEGRGEGRVLGDEVRRVIARCSVVKSSPSSEKKSAPSSSSGAQPSERPGARTAEPYRPVGLRYHETTSEACSTRPRNSAS